MAKPESELVSIGEFARAARMTVKTVRHYDAVGILKPARVDPWTRYRYYRWTQLKDALAIAALRDLDIPLARIRDHIVGGTPLHRILEAELTRLERQAARAARATAVIEQLVNSTRLPTYDADEIVITQIPTFTLLGTAHADTLVADAGMLISRLLDEAVSLGLDTTRPVLGEYPLSLQGSMSIQAHLELSGDRGRALEAKSEVPPTCFAGGTFARVTHTGPLESLPLAYYGLLCHLSDLGHKPTGPIFERHVDDPRSTDPERLRTQVLHAISSAP